MIIIYCKKGRAMERRYSRQREEILNVLSGTKSHPDAEWVYLEVKKAIPNISLGTVYRNLNEMVARGEIRAIETADQRLHYDYDTSSHQHFVCMSCGSILDLDLESTISRQVCEQGYAVESEQIVLYGECPRCVRAASCEKRV